MSAGRALVERYMAGFTAGDWDAVARCVADDFVEVYPQSGETIRGRENFRSLLQHMPAADGYQGALAPTSVHVLGGEDRWVLTPSFTTMKIEGTGDLFTVVFRVNYPDRSDWYVVSMLQLRDDRIARATTFFGPLFEPAEWRRPYVEVSARET